jgi:FtsP/CotA-like multicopper oxidase with cupredoxin domain
LYLPGSFCNSSFDNFQYCLDYCGHRYPGDGDFKHQRWNEKNAKTGGLEFQPKKFFQAIQAGARISGGARDKLQLHGYGKDAHGQPLAKFTEFGPTGLYHNTVTSPYALGGPLATSTGVLPDDANIKYLSAFEGTTKSIDVKIDPLNPAMPVQDKNAVWTFDGTVPPKLLMARYGETILFRHHNALPIDNQNHGFGTHTISTHEHNGHNPAESDGFAGAFFFPGQYYDYRWPMVLAGHDTINTDATNKRAATPCSATETSVGVFPCVTDLVSGSRTAYVPGDYRELMSTHWFHDHMIDHTAQNVYKGNAAAMNYYSAIDRGNEEINDGVNLRLPSGSAKEWGNRDYDLNLVVGDKAFDASGQLYFNPLYTDGFLGDVMTVNWIYKPFIDVRARRYRIRILNGSVSRYFKIAVAYQDATGALKQVPLHMIANDGNLLQHSIAFPNAPAGEGLPTQAIAERDDIIIDFAPLYAAGVKKVYLVNLMEHDTDAGPRIKPVTLAAAFNAFNGAKTTYNGKDLAIGKFMEFRLRPLPAGQIDQSMNPALYVEGAKVMQPLPTFTQAELKAAKHRTFIYGKKANAITDGAPWTIETDGVGGGLNAKVDRISAAPVKNSVEIWHLVNNSAGWSHPAHIHFEEGHIIARDGLAPPAWERLGCKDMYRIGPEIHSSKQVDVAIRVRDFNETYVEHCHNTQHEDHAMLLRWDIENADHLTSVRTPYPEWSGVVWNTMMFFMAKPLSIPLRIRAA